MPDWDIIKRGRDRHVVPRDEKTRHQVPEQRRGPDSLRESRDRLREGPRKAYGATWADMENGRRPHAERKAAEKAEQRRYDEVRDKNNNRYNRRTAIIAGLVSSVVAALIGGAFLLYSKSLDDPTPAPVPDRPAQIQPAPPTVPSPIPSPIPSPAPIPPG